MKTLTLSKCWLLSGIRASINVAVILIMAGCVTTSYRRQSAGVIIQPQTNIDQEAFCDDPKHIVTGGGYLWDGVIPPSGDHFILRNASCGSLIDSRGPQFCGGNPAGWHVSFVNLSKTGSTPFIQAYVYCAKP